MNLEELTRLAVQAALEAGELIRFYRDREVEVLHKEGGDTYASQVVTEVDRKAQELSLDSPIDRGIIQWMAEMTEKDQSVAAAAEPGEPDEPDEPGEPGEPDAPEEPGEPEAPDAPDALASATAAP